MMRTIPNLFRGGLLGAAVIACLLGAFTASAADKRPNIVFIFSDDHAYQAISAYGSKINHTPHLDRIANEGMLFTRCFVPNSICGPARATIQTGKYSHLNGFVRNGNVFDGSQQTFPKLMRKGGYQTAIVGKWHLASEPQGFDYWNVLIGQGPYYNPPMKTTDAEGKVVTVKHTGYTTDIIRDHAMKWLKEDRDPDKPFVLMFQQKAPHRDWEPAIRHLHLYDDVTIPEPDTLFDDYSGRGLAEQTQDMTIAKTMNDRDLKLVFPRNLTDEQRAAWEAAYGPKNEAYRQANLSGKEEVRWKYQRYIKDYLRCITAVDESVGTLLDYLDESGLAENTIVIYSSDQGFYLGEHGWFDKRWIFEESLRTPLKVRWPGVVQPGTTNGEIVSNLDFPETFLDIAGLPIPGDMQGRSLVPLLKGQTPADWRDSFYYHYYEFPGAHSVRRHYGVVTKRYKLFHFYEKDVDYWEMFDLFTDPKELTSVYGRKDYAEVQQQLAKELARLRVEFKVPEEDPESSFPRRRRR